MSLFKALANALRFLSVDAVEQANSGHPGMPLGMADIATVLWTKFLKHSPKNPQWFNRDRFILSNGHGSMLLYSLLHLTGYDLSANDLKRFRQLHSKTPGHPEYRETPGVETTTGPLGQGLTNAVGMAIAEKMLSTQFNQASHTLIDHYTYVFVGDGCLMEGISHEACSLAGTLGLNKLIVFYDENGISIDGKVDQWFTEDITKRFEAYNWHVIGPIDGHQPEAIETAILQAHQEIHKPILIRCKTVIGYGSQKAGSEEAHGAPLGKEALAALRTALDWPHLAFEIPDKIYQQWNHIEKGQHEENGWLTRCYAYQHDYPALYEEFLRRANGDLPDNWDIVSQAFIEKCKAQPKTQATRKSSQDCLNYFASILPELLGGSADLTASNNTNWSQSKAIHANDFAGNYINYGVREFAMMAIMTGLALHGGFIPYGGTFLVFCDYARNAIRLCALMKQRVIYVLTHDSIGLGEDGPTHQPIEHATMLRLTPNLEVWRPANLLETAVAWREAIEHHTGPSALLLSRQALPALTQTEEQTNCISKGAYIFYDNPRPPQVILIATGSEIHLALEAAKTVEEQDGLAVRVVSMPCCERFLAEDKAYQEEVLPSAVRNRIAIEAASTPYWYRFVGLDGIVLGIDSFGLSAPAEEVFHHFGLTTNHVMTAIRTLVNASSSFHNKP